MGVKINTVKGLFGDPVPDKKFDRVLFYEAFHHSLDHADTLLRLRDVLKPEGQLLLAGEPVIAKDNYWRDIVPFAWGPRLDGLSLRAIRTYGWCELGFQREYLVEQMMRTGWLLQFRKCLATDRGDVYTAVMAGEVIDLGNASFLIESTTKDDGWFDGEGETRWTRGNASVGLDQTRHARSAEVKLHNFLPMARRVDLMAAGKPVAVNLEPGEVRTVTVPLGTNYGSLSIGCKPVVISEIIEGLDDPRRVGIAISTLRYVT
jgi:SAM-dependent methyltransferase